MRANKRGFTPLESPATAACGRRTLNKNRRNGSLAGFTLIELLVVIAIIGLLSTVVLASLTTARNKARDAAVRSGARQLATLMELEYNDTKSYAALQSGWDYTAADCSNSFTGAYAENARQICSSIVTATGPSGMHTGVHSNGSATNFSVMAYLPAKGAWFCVGSSGRTSDNEPGIGWGDYGCYNNP